jgi:hypothetical protein
MLNRVCRVEKPQEMEMRLAKTAPMAVKLVVETFNELEYERECLDEEGVICIGSESFQNVDHQVN